MSRVKIVATIGPTTRGPEALIALRDAGMNVARLNGAHSTLEWHGATIETIRATLPGLPIILDIPGRKIRTAKTGIPVPVSRGAAITFIGSAKAGDDATVIEYPLLHQVLEPGDPIKIDDGRLLFTVKAIEGQHVVCECHSNGAITDAKGVYLPRTLATSWSLTDRDKELLVFAREQGVDFAAISFVETPNDVETAKAALGTQSVGVIAKIETASALKHVAAIAEVADALMVDRGDLSLDVPVEAIALYQKHIVKVGNRAGRPVIGATEILHSMIQDSVPTKAEVSDITNSVLDGCSALMLSGETAAGSHPIEAVSVMRRVADIAVEGIGHDRGITHEDSAPSGSAGDQRSIPDAMGESIAMMCTQLPITKIVAVTMGGYAARRISTQMPQQPVIAVTNDADAARRMNLLPGTTGVFVDIPFSRTDTNHIPRCLHELWKAGALVDEDLILVTSVSYPKSGNRMNLVETHIVGDLRESLGWE